MRNVKSWTFLIGLILSLPLAGVCHGQAFQPDLSLAREVIGSQADPSAPIPADDPLLTKYPMETEPLLPVLVEVPGKPFRQVDPPPRSLAWWKYPFYVALGLPRDLADSVFGVLGYVPLVSPTVVYVGYEVVPVQWILRDPRDWHRWPGRRNSRGHGLIDSESWGWFPSAHSWHFSYESKWKLRRNQAYNAKLEARLDEMNREIEVSNQAVSNRQREARREAYAAIGKGDGDEAARRMMPYRMAYPLDEGAFALFVTAMALDYPRAPDWARAFLWEEIDMAQSDALGQTVRLLEASLEQQPGHPGLIETLIYIDLTQGEESSARDRADAYLSRNPDSPHVLRLAFETHLTAEDPAAARQVFERMDKAQYDAETWDMMQVRLALAGNQPGLAGELIDSYDENGSTRADLNYYRGLAALQQVENEGEPVATLKEAFDSLERAVLTADNDAMRARAGKALGFVRAALAEFAP